MGKFHDDNDNDQYFTEQKEVEDKQLSAQLRVEVGTSKHAARRAKKKKKAQQIICDADPSLKDLE